MNPEQARWFGENFANVVGNVERVIIGKAEAIRLAVTCLLAEGHLLLEDYPGTGKTTLARALAQSVQGTNSRIQFTPDLLPSDVTGVTIYDQPAVHGNGDPMTPFLAWANRQSDDLGSLKAGQIITTGSLCGGVLSPGKGEVVTRLSPLATVTLTLR